MSHGDKIKTKKSGKKATYSIVNTESVYKTYSLKSYAFVFQEMIWMVLYCLHIEKLVPENCMCKNCMSRFIGVITLH